MPSLLLIYEAKKESIYFLLLSIAPKTRQSVVFLLVVLLLGDTAHSLPPSLKIGAIFTTNQKGGSTELAFKYAVHNINNDKVLLPNTRLVYDLTYVPRNDSFRAFKNACRQIRLGVQAVFGPTDPLIGTHIHSVCDALDIPHIECRLDLDTRSKEFSINLYPSQPLLNQAYLDIVKFLNWTRIAVIYEESYGLFKLRELIRTPSSEVDIYLRQVTPESYRKVLQGVKQKDIHNLVVDVKPDNVGTFLEQVLDLKMNDYKYHYIFTYFDVDRAHLGDLGNQFINLTAFRLIDPEDENTQRLLSNMENFIQDTSLQHDKYELIQTEPALMYDSVYAFATGLQALERGHTLMLSNVSCEAEVPWNGGLSLINYINSVEMRGLTGPVEFKEGKRVKFQLDILKLKAQEIVKVGEWRPNTGVRITEQALFFDPDDVNVTLAVTTILEQPYVMLKTRANRTENITLEGFCIDLLDAIASLVGFDYKITLVPDGKYGVYNYKTGEWNGMVRQLIDKKADLAVGSMTINYARESVIDFTKPFMNLGISILFKMPQSHAAKLFSFMNPLALNIWLYILAAYALVSLTILIVARLSPYEWQNPHPCSIASSIVVNPFSLGNCFWFTVGTLMQQGSDLNPKATSTRIVGATWWFFTLIIISSYTANLAAFLTVERMITPIENAEDLAGQTEIPYGTLESGSTMTFFRDSMIETYKKMWRFMDSKKPSVFVSTYEEGIQRVLDGKYAFLMESTMLDYIMQRDCNLMQIGGLLDNKGYGIGTPMGSPWRDKISLAILELQEKGEIQILYDKWWKKSTSVCKRAGKEKDTKANSLGVVNIGGVFIVLLAGLGVAVLVAIFEFCYYSKYTISTDKRGGSLPQQSLFQEMAAEFCFAMRCRGSRQRPAFKSQCSKCISSNVYLPPKPEPPPVTEEITLNVPLPEIWKSCNKIRAAIFRFGINLYDYFKPLDPNNNNLISENQFVSVLGKQLRSLIGLSDQEISELADYFKVQDGRIFYRQLCDVIHKSIPDFSQNPPLTTGLEWEDPVHENALGPTEERKIDIIMTKIAASVNKRQLILRPFFQDYELLSKNCGTITIAHFGRILYFLGIILGSEEFNLLVKKYLKDSCTLSYNAFLARLDAITRFWEENGTTDLGGDLVDQFPGRLINAELPKLPRPEIGRVPTENIFGFQKITHPVMEKKPPPDDLQIVMKRIQKYVLTNGIRTVDFFQPYDGLNCGKITCNQFRRGLDMMGYGGLYLSEPEIWQLIVFYRDPNDGDRVCWRTFTDDVDQVFTTKKLEKWPEYRVESAPSDVMELPRKGQIAWINVEPVVRDICEETLEKLKKKITQRRLSLKPEFKNYDKHNIGHVSRSQYRQCLLTNGILLAPEEMNSLEKRFVDDIGFNYFAFLKELEAQTLEEPLYNEYVKKLKKVNCKEAEETPTVCERDIVMILAKIKAKVVRERLDLMPYFRDHDCHNEKVVNKCNFIRAMDLCQVGLSGTEVETIMQVFSSPGRSGYVDYVAFVRTINEAFTQSDLERAPLIIPTPHYPSESDPRNFLNFNERHIVAVALEKLAVLPDMNLEELFAAYDKERCGSITTEQFHKALALRNMLHLISTTERATICKAFSYYRGLRDEVDYRAFLRALNILQVNLKRKPV